jgi:elongation factor G
MKPNLDRVRNIGIAAHVDAGKTTLTERILYYTGANHRIGEVHEAAAHMDYLPEEREHGITITTAVTRCPWKDHAIQVVDTPGHVDFTIEVERSMRVLDGAIIVMDGVRGVEPQTETVWRQAKQFDIPRLLFINKMDKPGADFFASLDMVEERLGGNPVPICIPLEDGSVIDLVDQKHIRFSGNLGQDTTVGEIPEEHLDLVELYRESTLLAAAEEDEELEELVLMEEEVDPEQVWAALRKATIEGRIHPAFGGSSLRNWGVQPILDGVLKLLPSPKERPASSAKTLDGEECIVEMVNDGPMVALAFKVQMWEGRRHVFARIYRGTLKPGDKIRIAGKDKEERVARVFDVDANTKKRLDHAEAGQIVLLAGLRFTTTGDTICSAEQELLLEAIEAKEPVLGLAIEAESTKDESKMLEAIAKVCEEDPTVRFEEDEETGQRILRGMGELHLQIIFERLQREFKLKIRAGRPRVTVRETISGSGSATITLDRTIRVGDKELKLKAKAKAVASPNVRGGGIDFTVQPSILPPGSSLSSDQLQAIESGVKDSLMGGPIEGAPLEDVKVQLEEVSLFEGASTPQALRIVAAQAVREALIDAGGIKLQPIMKIEVVVPDEYVGGVQGDLLSRHSIITGQKSSMGATSLLGECPLEKLLGYMTELRSMTRGRGTFTMEFSRFDALRR